MQRAHPHSVALDRQLPDVDLPKREAKAGNDQQCFGRRGQRPIPVLPFGPQALDVIGALDLAQTSICLDSQVFTFDVVLGNMRIQREVEGDLLVLLDGLTFTFGDGLGHQLAVQVKANRCDMARLDLRQEIAGPAHLKVAHCDLVARAEVGELADHLQPFIGLFGQLSVPRVKQICVRPLPRAPHPPT